MQGVDQYDVASAIVQHGGTLDEAYQVTIIGAVGIASSARGTLDGECAGAKGQRVDGARDNDVRGGGSEQSKAAEDTSHR